MSIYGFCPLCGSDSKSLLNLVSCIAPGCRNHCPKWENEWRRNNRPRFTNNHRFGTSHTFLGNHVSRRGVTYDLYHSVSYGGDHVCLARFGNSDDQCYYVDGDETDIGTVAGGSTTLTDPDIGTALKRALKIARSRKLIPRKP